MLYHCAIELCGAPASGKSTLFTRLEKDLNTNESFTVSLPEALDFWDHSNNVGSSRGFFQDYLGGAIWNSFNFQTTVLGSHLFQDYQGVMEAKTMAKYHRNVILLKDGSVQNSLTYMKAGHRNFTFPQYTLLEDYAWAVKSKITVSDIIVFMDCPFHVTLERMARRNRRGEDLYDLKYLREVHTAFGELAETLPQEKLIRVRGEEDIQVIYTRVQEMVEARNNTYLSPSRKEGAQEYEVASVSGFVVEWADTDEAEVDEEVREVLLVPEVGIGERVDEYVATDEEVVREGDVEVLIITV